VLIFIGMMLGRIGRAARQAEVAPPPAVTATPPAAPPVAAPAATPNGVAANPVTAPTAPTAAPVAPVATVPPAGPTRS